MRPPFRVASIAYACYTVPGQLSSPKTEPSNHPARRPLMLWNDWWNLVCELRPACARTRTFLWMSLCLAGFSTRKDLLGVTSIVRALGLEPACYDRLLDFFHSPALDLDKLTQASFASTSSPSSSATASRSPRPDARCPEPKNSIKNPTQTPSRSTSSATPAKPSPCSPKPCPAYSPCLWPVASTKARCFPTATTEPCWTRWSCCSTRWN